MGFLEAIEPKAPRAAAGSGLQGEARPFFSRPVAPRHRALAAYERELIGLVHAVRHWRPYLWGRRFVVKTDHFSLKYLLDQRLSTIPQHHWVGKLLGFDFSVEYKPGQSNAVADALSRRDTPDDGVVMVLSSPRFDFIDRLRQAQATDPALVSLHDEIRAGTRSLPWELADGLVQYGGRLYIPPSSPLLQEALLAVHEEGHEGVQRTLHRLRRDFHFPNMKRTDVLPPSSPRPDREDGGQPSGRDEAPQDTAGFPHSRCEGFRQQKPWERIVVV